MNFLLLPGPDGGLDGVLFDARHMEEAFDDYVSVTFLILEDLLLRIPHLHSIVNTFVLIFVGSLHIKIFLCYMKQTDRNILNKNEILLNSDSISIYN